MSTFSHQYEERLCRICDGYDVEYQDDHYVLFPTSIRRYAHAQCMVGKYGVEGAIAKMRHQWQQREFRKSLNFPITKGKKHPLAKTLERITR